MDMSYNPIQVTTMFLKLEMLEVSFHLNSSINFSNNKFAHSDESIHQIRRSGNSKEHFVAASRAVSERQLSVMIQLAFCFAEATICLSLTVYEMLTSNNKNTVQLERWATTSTSYKP